MAIPRQARTERTRAKILAGAAKVLSKRGIRAATVEDILKAAGVSRRTYYQYFKSKEAALTTLYGNATTEMVHAVGLAIEDTDDPIGQVKAAVHAYLDFQKKGGDLLIGLQAEAIRPDSLLTERREQTIDELVELLDDAVHRATELRLEPLVFRGLLMAMEALVIHLQRMGRFSEADRERVERVGTAMWMSVLASAPSQPQRVA